MALPSGVRYSILRNNVQVPLIPVDQLPFYIQGLPRELTPFRKHQESWTLVGETQEPAVPVSIRAPSNTLSSASSAGTNRQFLPPDYDACRIPLTVSQGSRLMSETRVSSVTRAERPVSCLVNTCPQEHLPPLMTGRFAAARSEGILPYRLPYPSGVEPDSSKKQFCTHWIRTNSCDFMQQGCKYKHEMPHREKLKELGFAEIPKWYRDKMAISAGSSSWLRPRAPQDNNDRQLSVEPSASRAFRPSIIGTCRSHSRTTELPGSPTPKTDQSTDNLPNLIDLDDVSMTTVSLAPPLSAKPSSDTYSLGLKNAAAQISEQITKTLASSLRHEQLEVKNHADVSPDALNPRSLGRHMLDDASPVADALPTRGTPDSRTGTSFVSVVPSLSSGQKASKENKINAAEMTRRERSIVKSSEAMRMVTKGNSGSCKSQQKRNSRSRKLVDHSAVSAILVGLTSSQYAPSNKSREETLPKSKGLKHCEIREEGRNLQFEILQRQCAGHLKNNSVRV